MKSILCNPYLIGMFCFNLFLSSVLNLASGQSEPEQDNPTSNTGIINKSGRIADFRYTIPSGDFVYYKDEDVWRTKTINSEFLFDELIYSWKVKLPKTEGFRLYLQVLFEDGQASPWLYAGYWGTVKPEKDRNSPVFDFGILEQDHLKMKRKAFGFSLMIKSEGEKKLSVIPEFRVIITDNSPSEANEKKYAFKNPDGKSSPGIVYDLPLRAQEDSKGQYIPQKCQSAALASAMEYFGKKINLEDIVPFTFDPEYDQSGIWPRTLQAAVEFGFDSYIDRFRTWDYVKYTLSQGKIILCSITMPAKDTYIAPPYPSMSGHIVALNGVTDDGRVIVTDSAMVKSGKGYQCQWKAEDFEKIWIRNKGGVGMVICPPEGFQKKVVKDLPPFPDRTKKEQTSLD